MIKFLVYAIPAFLLLMSCAEEVENETAQQTTDPIELLEVPDTEIDKSALHYNNETSIWTLDGHCFSGYALTYFPDHSLQQKFGVLDGKKQNEAMDWFVDGHIRKSSFYHNGKLHGEKKTWSEESNHLLISHLNYREGKAHGVQKKWYPTGEIFKVLNLNMGKEEGIQQAFRKNGKLFANYEAKKGRIFGLKKAALCFELDNEKVLYEK